MEKQDILTWVGQLVESYAMTQTGIAQSSFIREAGNVVNALGAELSKEPVDSPYDDQFAKRSELNGEIEELTKQRDVLHGIVEALTSEATADANA